MPAIDVVIDRVVPLKESKKRVEFHIGGQYWNFTMWRQQGCRTPVMETHCVGLLNEEEHTALIRALKKDRRF